MKRSLVFLSCVLVALLSVFTSVHARGVWGAKRKREEVEEAEVDAGGDPLEGFEASRRKFESRRPNPSAAVRAGGSGASTGFTMPSRDQIIMIVDSYIDVMENMMDNPDFQKTMTLENIRSMFEKMGLSDNPDIAKLFESDEFSNPEVLKATIVEGIRSMKTYSSQLADLLSDPDQVAMLLEQLPSEMKEVVQSLLSGDMSGLKDIVAKLPGLSRAQKRMLTSMLDSQTDPTQVNSAVSELLGDPDQVEAARQQMLENPAMAEMLGVPLDVIKDKKKFEELLAQGLEAMNTGGSAQIEGEEPDLSAFERKFSSKMAAA